ncbi:hypothetical protein GBF38_011959 [Nibea albiflora]|uniref:Uncharacterized protein n=1 Tax=Nibea albiflora TaxID=240163 RepID=A0ACB7EHT5_NIBAL|nr:hypothetical protein GBF38_011959 [Nibea albiflora]
MEFVKPGGGQQSLRELDYSCCLLCERQDELLWAEHVICNSYTSETEGKQAGKRRAGGIILPLPILPIQPPLLSPFVHLENKSPQTLQLLYQDQAEEKGDEGCSSMLPIQEKKCSAGSDDTKQQSDSRLSCRVRTVWRRLDQDIHTFAAGAVESLQPCFMSSPLVLRNRCSLDDGELVMMPHKNRVVGRPLLETRRTPFELPASDISQNNRAHGSCDVLRVFRRHTAPDLKIYFGEESDSDLEELLADEDDEDEHADTD